MGSSGRTSTADYRFTSSVIGKGKSYLVISIKKTLPGAYQLFKIDRRQISSELLSTGPPTLGLVATNA